MQRVHVMYKMVKIKMNPRMLTVAYPIFLQNCLHRAHTTNGRPPWFDILF